MATLQELLLTPENAPHLIADTQALVDGEISSKGITAAPLKAAYKAVKSFAPGYYQEVISAMLPGWSTSLSRTGLTSPRRVVPTSATTWPSAATRCPSRCSP